MSVVEKNPPIPGLEQSVAETPPPHRWTLVEYDQLGDAGLLGGCRTELIDGEIFDMPPQKDAHRLTVGRVFKLLARALDDSDGWLTSQGTLRLAEGQAPEPDVAVEAPQSLKRDSNIIAKPLLVVEVSDESLLYDRRIKSRLYASCAVADYWIVNLVDRQLEVHRQLTQRADGQWHYAQHLVLHPPQTVSPLFKPDLSFEVSQLFV